jgi:hypothetical protein
MRARCATMNSPIVECCSDARWQKWHRCSSAAFGGPVHQVGPREPSTARSVRFERRRRSRRFEALRGIAVNGEGEK